MKESIIAQKSYNFAIKVINLYSDLSKKKEYDIGRQILRSGTSIGANVRESLGGQSKKDFLSKISISYKEAIETEYWLKLLTDTNKISKETSVNLLTDIDEIIRIIGKIQVTVKRNIGYQSSNNS